MTATGPRLITLFGGSGFLGRHIVRALADRGWRIRVAVRRPHAAYYLKPLGRVGQIQIVHANVRKDADVAAALDGADAAIDLVGILAQWGAQRFAALHVEAAERIARLAAAAGTRRLIHVSALGASLEAPAQYFRTKAEGEERVRATFPQATIVRPALVFGPEDDFFNRFAALARMIPVLPLFGGGHTRFQPVFVGDIAQSIVRLLERPETAGATFELAGPEIMTFKEIMQFVLHQTHRRRALMTVPFGLGELKGAFLQFLPKAPLTRDQVLMLKTDTVASGTAPGLSDLGLVPTAAEAIVPSYLWRFRPRGQFEAAPG